MKFIIVLNGEIPKNITADFFKSKKVVCADGAYDKILHYKIKLFAVVGDMDSASSREIVADNIIIYPADKDKTDGQLALEYCARSGAKEITIIGAAGKRDDHYLGNLSLLALAHKKGIKARILTDFSQIYYFKGQFECEVIKNKYFSIVPFSDLLHIICTEGLKYEICRKTLKSCDTLGISNETTADTVKITAGRGSGLAIMSFEDIRQ